MDSLSLAYKLASIIVTRFLAEEPLSKVVQGHIDSAIDDCRNIQQENNYHATFIRVITNLSAAYHIHINSIRTWKWGDSMKISLFYQHEKSNRICLFIACIYFVLGNQNMVEEWLLKKMSPQGPYNNLGIELFTYEQMLGKNYEYFIENIAKPSDEIQHLIEIRDDAADAHWEMDRMFGGHGF